MSWRSHMVVAADDTRLHVRHVTSGSRLTTCVLIHGSGDGSYVWASAWRALQSLCDVVAVDLRGHGDSEWSRSGRYDVTVHVEDIVRVIEQLELERLVVVGHSLGGLVAIHLAAQRLRARVQAAILVDICPEPRLECVDQVLSGIVASLRVYQSIDEYCTWLMETRPLLTATIAEQLAADALRPCEGGYALKLDAAAVNGSRRDPDTWHAERYWTLLRAISCPTLVVRGEGSAMVSATSAQQMVQLLARGELAIIPRTGHAVISDNPEAFCRATSDFIAGLFAGDAAALSLA